MKIYPTLKEIRELSGEDLIINLGSEEKAMAELRQNTELFYRTLNKENITVTYNRMCLLIKDNPRWQSEYKTLMGSLVYQDWNTDKAKEEIVLDLINGSDLFSNKRIWHL